MKKEVYLVIIKCVQYNVRNDNGKTVEDKTDAQYLVDTFHSYEAAVSHVDNLVDGQKKLESNVKFEYYGVNRKDLFEKSKTTVHGWPYNKVLYGIEAITEVTTPYNNREIFVMNRFIIKQEVK